MAFGSSTKPIDQSRDPAAESQYGVSLLASTLAHEIRNPLQTIRLLISAAKRGSSVLQALDGISENVDRLESVVARVQQLSRKYVLHRERVNLRALVESVQASLNFWLSASGIVMTTDINLDANFLVDCDRELLQQVLLNLSINAIQAMPKGGRIFFRIFDDEEYVVFEIEDTGGGMSAEVLKHIGTPFFTTKSSGSGLGVSFCKTIASLHGGSLAFDSSVDTGTKATLRLQKFDFISSQHLNSGGNPHVAQ